VEGSEKREAATVNKTKNTRLGRDFKTIVTDGRGGGTRGRRPANVKRNEDEKRVLQLLGIRDQTAEGS